ncbi:MAG: hypothetical protein FJZ89_09205 [Chloroflexi bacterium]|nr:hypothetical protein [Chloroflexota bacterium]
MADEEHLRQIIRSFRRRLRQQYAIGLTGLAAILCLAITSTTLFGVSAPALALLVLLLMAALTLWNWRCPACNRLLRIGSKPVVCPHCGTQLR